MSTSLAIINDLTNAVRKNRAKPIIKHPVGSENVENVIVPNRTLIMSSKQGRKLTSKKLANQRKQTSRMQKSKQTSSTFSHRRLANKPDNTMQSEGLSPLKPISTNYPQKKLKYLFKPDINHPASIEGNRFIFNEQL